MKTLRIVSCPLPSVNPYLPCSSELSRGSVRVEYLDNSCGLPSSDRRGARSTPSTSTGASKELALLREKGPWTALGLATWDRFLRRAKRAGVRILWTAHELSPPEFGTWIDRLGYQLCAQAADLRVPQRGVPGPGGSRFGVAAARTIAIPMGRYEGSWSRRSRPRHALQLGVPAGRHLLSASATSVHGRASSRAGGHALAPRDCHLVVQGSTRARNSSG